jgi:hypothetical protein
MHHDGIGSNAGHRRRVAAWLSVLALACGRADDAKSSSSPTDVGSSDAGSSDAGGPAASSPDASSTGDDGNIDAGASLPSGAGTECPAPRPNATSYVAAGWAREPGTGQCCRYVNRSTAPTGWLRFDDEAACKASCLCSALEGFEGDFEDLLPVPDSLECRCSIESCPSTPEEAAQSMCTASEIYMPAVQRLVGCGMVVVIDRNGFAGHKWVFEQPSASGDAARSAPALVGASKFSDADTSEACPSSSWSVGREFFDECDAAEVVTCQLCGDSPGPEYPPCQ